MARKKKSSGGGLVSGIVTILLLSMLVEYLAPVLLPIVIGGGIVLLIVFILNHSGSNSDKTAPEPVASQPAFDLQREVEILKDCQNIVNESANLDTVEYRYNLLIEKLRYFSSFSDDELRQRGVSFGKPVQEYLNDTINMKSAVFCQAIERAGEKCRKHIQSLATQRGKENTLRKFYDTSSATIGNCAKIKLANETRDRVIPIA